MRLRLQELQETKSEAQELRQQKADDYKEIDEIFYHQGLSFVPKAIWTELISRHYDNSLAGHFGIEKICELLVQKYYSPTFCHDVEAYVKGCDICLTFKAVRHKPYGDLQLLPILTHRWKDLLISFVTGLPVSINWKKESYDFILVIIDWLIKMVHCKLLKITLDVTGLAEVIMDVVVDHHGFSGLIVTHREFLFISKFWSSLCFFLSIKHRLFTAFQP